MPPARSLYDVLNVAPDAEPVVIEAAYRALMKQYHPDQTAALASTHRRRSAAEINEAVSILRDPVLRARYDHQLWVRRTGFDQQRFSTRPPRGRLRPIERSGWLLALLLGCCLIFLAAERILLRKAAADDAADPPMTSLAVHAAEERPLSLSSMPADPMGDDLEPQLPAIGFAGATAEGIGTPIAQASPVSSPRGPAAGATPVSLPRLQTAPETAAADPSISATAEEGAPADAETFVH